MMPGPGLVTIAPERLAELAEAATGTPRWRGLLARRWGLGRKTVERWAITGTAPGWIEDALLGMIAQRQGVIERDGPTPTARGV